MLKALALEGRRTLLPEGEAILFRGGEELPHDACLATGGWGSAGDLDRP